MKWTSVIIYLVAGFMKVSTLGLGVELRFLLLLSINQNYYKILERDWLLPA